MSRSIFDKRLPNGGLGTQPPKAPAVKVAIAEQITPTLQSLTYMSVPADSPLLAEVKPASEEFGKGISVAAPGCAEMQGGASMPIAPYVVPTIEGGNKSHG